MTSRCIWKEFGQCKNPVTQMLAGKHPMCDEHYAEMVKLINIADKEIEEKGYFEFEGEQYKRGENYV